MIEKKNTLRSSDYVVVFRNSQKEMRNCVIENWRIFFSLCPCQTAIVFIMNVNKFIHLTLDADERLKYYAERSLSLKIHTCDRKIFVCVVCFFTFPMSTGWVFRQIRRKKKKRNGQRKRVPWPSSTKVYFTIYMFWLDKMCKVYEFFRKASHI